MYSDLRAAEISCLSCIIIFSTKCFRPPGIPWTYVWLLTTIIAWLLDTAEGLAFCFVMGYALNVTWYSTQYVDIHLWRSIIAYWESHFPAWYVGPLIRSGDILLHPLPLLLLWRSSEFVTVEVCLYAFLTERVYIQAVESAHPRSAGRKINEIYDFRPPRPLTTFHTVDLVSTVSYFSAALISLAFPLLGAAAIFLTGFIILAIVIARKRRIAYYTKKPSGVAKFESTESDAVTKAWQYEMLDTMVEEVERHREAFMDFVDDWKPSTGSLSLPSLNLPTNISDKLSTTCTSVSDSIKEFRASLPVQYVNYNSVMRESLASTFNNVNFPRIPQLTFDTMWLPKVPAPPFVAQLWGSGDSTPVLADTTSQPNTAPPILIGVMFSQLCAKLVSHTRRS